MGVSGKTTRKSGGETAEERVVEDAGGTGAGRGEASATLCDSHKRKVSGRRKNHDNLTQLYYEGRRLSA